MNLTLMVLALSQSHNCRLATLVTVWPIFGKRESLIQRARRWLSNRYLNQRIYYFPLVKHILDNWDGVEIALSMDRTDIHNHLSILMVGVCYKKRVIPLAWMVLGYGATSAFAQGKYASARRQGLESVTVLEAMRHYGATEVKEWLAKLDDKLEE